MLAVSEISLVAVVVVVVSNITIVIITWLLAGGRKIEFRNINTNTNDIDSVDVSCLDESGLVPYRDPDREDQESGTA